MIEYFLLVYLAIGSGGFTPKVELYDNYGTAKKWADSCNPDEHCQVLKVSQKAQSVITRLDKDLLTNKMSIDQHVEYELPTIEEATETEVAPD